MKSGMKVVNHIVRNVIVLCICICAVRGISRCEEAAVCEAKTISDKSSDKAEVEKFVTAFYEAHNKKDVETLANYAEDSKGWSEYIFRVKAHCEYGVQKYDHINIDVYPLSDGKHWLAYVCYELIIEDFDTELPGASAELVGRDRNGNLVIETYSDKEMKELSGEMTEILQSDEVMDKMNTVQMKYNDIVYENPDIMEWLFEFQNDVTQALAEYYEDYDKENKHERNDFYTVQKGDCLWDIAEEQLGDGMYWGKLYEANRSVIGEDPDLLFVGITLQLKAVNQ